MWNYQKRLQYPINIKNPNPKLASFIVSQYGGPHGNCLSDFLLSPKHAFKRFSVVCALDDFFENRSCSPVFFGVAYGIIPQNIRQSAKLCRFFLGFVF